MIDIMQRQAEVYINEFFASDEVKSYVDESCLGFPCSSERVSEIEAEINDMLTSKIQSDNLTDVYLVRFLKRCTIDCSFVIETRSLAFTVRYRDNSLC